MKINTTLLFVFVLVVIVIGLWFGWYIYVQHAIPETTTITDNQAKILAAQGQLGDIFGGVNALFTALLLAGALYTIFLQQRQIATLHVQQLAQERDNQKFVTLQAMTALVNARSALLHTRYEMHRDASRALRDNTVDPQWVHYFQALVYNNLETAGKDMESLGELADELDQVLYERVEDVDNKA